MFIIIAWKDERPFSTLIVEHTHPSTMSKTSVHKNGRHVINSFFSQSFVPVFPYSIINQNHERYTNFITIIFILYN